MDDGLILEMDSEILCLVVMDAVRRPPPRTTCGPAARSTHEWQEGMVITGTDQPRKQAWGPIARCSNNPGREDRNTRGFGDDTNPPRGVNYRDVKIHVINFKGRL